MLSHICVCWCWWDANEWTVKQAKKNQITFSFSWESQVTESLSVSLRFHAIFPLRSCSELLSLLIAHCLFLFLPSFIFFSSLTSLFVSFGYTIQRLFIIQFSFFSDAKRRSSTWIGRKKLKIFNSSCPFFADPGIKIIKDKEWRKKSFCANWKRILKAI